MCTAINTDASDADAAVGSVPRATIHFLVDVGVIRPWEHVFVAGSTPTLGAWLPSNALKLTQETDSPHKWIGSVSADADRIAFRYFIGYFLHSGREDAENELVISKYESFLHPRFVKLKINSDIKLVDWQLNDKFGWNGGRNMISEGWLAGQDQCEILLRLHGNPFKFYKKRHADRSYCVKVTPFDLRLKEMYNYDVKGRNLWRECSLYKASTGSMEEDEDDGPDTSLLPSQPSFSVSHIAVLSSDDPFYREQLPSGECFKVGADYFIFRTRSVAVEFLGFRIELFVHDERYGPMAERFAICYALPSSLKGTAGSAAEPLLAKNRPIGQITVEYMIIKAMQGALKPQQMDITYSKHWKKRQALEVGHRGMGNSYTKMAVGRENTIHSLNSAARNGADYVEFDVQLTKDKVPVIFHDFHVLVTVAKRRRKELPQSEDANDYHEMAIKDLKLSQLKLLSLEHYKANVSEHKNYTRVNAEADETDERLPFPTLADALTQVDPSVGFNVEVKYPMMQKNGLHECENYFEYNEYIDIILNDVFKHAGDRRIMFSSFEPDICSILVTKQQIYPVLFLCVGVTTRYEPFVDLRSSTSDNAVRFAACIDILGVNFHSEDLLRDSSPIQQARKWQLISFVWGDDLDSKDNINYFKKEVRVDGLIYDRIGEIEARRNVFSVEREAKSKLFRKNLSPSTSQTVSLDEPPPSPNSSEHSYSSNSTLSPIHSPCVTSVYRTSDTVCTSIGVKNKLDKSEKLNGYSEAVRRPFFDH